MADKTASEQSQTVPSKGSSVAKDTIMFYIKPWDVETNLEELEKNVRSIKMDGLIWGISRQVPIAYGVRKLQISCAIEDNKVSVDSIEEHILAFEDLVQSVDVPCIHKI